MEPIEFGKEIRALRKEKGMTLAELSRESGISHPYLSQIENGKFTPSPEILKKLSGPLGKSHAELMVLAGHVTYEDWFQGKVGQSGENEYDNLFWHVMLGFSSREEMEEASKKLKEEVQIVEQLSDIKNFLEVGYRLQSTGALITPTYNGHKLTEQDRQRILDMLKLMFPEYAPKED